MSKTPRKTRAFTGRPFGMAPALEGSMATTTRQQRLDRIAELSDEWAHLSETLENQTLLTDEQVCEFELALRSVDAELAELAGTV